MNNVVQLISPEEDIDVWECSCGYQCFFITKGHVQCVQCDVMHPIAVTLKQQAAVEQ